MQIHHVVLRISLFFAVGLVKYGALWRNKGGITYGYEVGHAYCNRVIRTEKWQYC